jgi:hypothetical protein
MPSHYVSLPQGDDGSSYASFTTGAVSSGQVIELRLDDSLAFRPTDIRKALDAFERFFTNAQQWAPAGFNING